MIITGAGQRHVPVHEIYRSLYAVVCEILPTSHTITGCDTTSAMFGIDKKSL